MSVGVLALVAYVPLQMCLRQLQAGVAQGACLLLSPCSTVANLPARMCRMEHGVLSGVETISECRQSQ